MKIQTLIEKLSDPDESERIFAADDLGATNDAAAVEPLAARLAIESSRAVREMIILALRNIQRDSVLDRAADLLTSEDPFIRNEMASLLQSRGEYAVPWLQNALKHPDADVRKLALEAAAHLPETEARPFFEAGLSDSDSNVVMSAIENLSAADVMSFQRRLEVIANASSSPMLTVACIEALGKLEDWDSLDAFLAAFHDREELQYSLVGAVGSSGGARHLPFLKMCSENSMLRQGVVDALLKLHTKGQFANLDFGWVASIADWARDGQPAALKRDSILLLGRLTSQPSAIVLADELKAETQNDE